MTVTETGEQIGEGIIDGAPFEECSYYETEDYNHPDWEWTQYTLEEIIHNNSKCQRYYKGLENEYHRAVRENKKLRDENEELKEENEILRGKIAQIKGYLNAM
jgi:predicted RNase H-like nuclease (RuvC/YqgF family)